MRYKIPSTSGVRMEKKVKLKDIDKIYKLTAKCIKVFNRNGKLLLYSELKGISHFGIVRDYTIELRFGGEVHLDYGVVKELVKHEIKENWNEYKNEITTS